MRRPPELLEGPSLVSECSDGGSCDLSSGCLIQGGIHGVAKRIRAVLEEFSLADLAENPQDPSTLERLAV